MRKTVFIFLISFLFNNAFTQGVLRGKISDQNGESIVGATVMVKELPTLGTISDLNGNYSLKIPSSSPKTIIISYVSYSTVQDTVVIKDGDVLVRNYTMVPQALELEDVVIVAKAQREKDSYMRAIKINSPISLDYISKETISKTGDSNIDDAVKRVTGVSMVDGYITVRGLADRYIRTTINGFKIPTLDPLSNNIKLDMFPTSLIDNIVITKTVSPDLPGDWAGSYLSIETKDYPEDLIINVKSSFGYNTQSSFSTIVSSKRSKTDWLGYDNGFRDITSYSLEDFPEYIRNTSPYYEFRELGIGDFLDENGISMENLPRPPSLNEDYFLNNPYYRMGLVELGLLIPGYINDDEEVLKAIESYYSNPELKQKAHLAINEDAIEYGASLPNNWLHIQRNTLMDYSQDISIGNQLELFGKPFGFIAGLRYSTSTDYDPETRKEIGYFSREGDETGEFQSVINYDRQLSLEVNQWSAIFNAAYRPNHNHTISLMLMPNFSGVNSVKVDTGFNEYAYSNYDFLQAYSSQQYYEERKQVVYQISSSHYFPNPALRIEFGASYTDGQSNTPDFKTMRYGKTMEGYEFRQYFQPRRNFRFLDENTSEVRISGFLPFLEKPGLPRKIKFGASNIYTNRENNQFSYFLSGGTGGSEIHDTPEELFQKLDTENFRNYSTVTNAVLNSYNLLYLPTDNSKGYSRVTAGFLMLDYTLIKRLRLTGGLRIERTDIYTDIGDFYGEGIPENDPSRIISLPGFGIRLYANPNSIKKTNYLPSINLVYKLFNNNKLASNLRLSYSETLGRPTIREVSAYFDYNYDVDNYILGNTSLRMVDIRNYDLRLESYFSNGDNFSMSLFFKEFDDHIELGNENAYFTWRNAPGTSTAVGFEIEGRKQFLKNFELMGNLTLIESKAVIQLAYNGVLADTVSRTMYGQSPYIINGILAYNSEKAGLTASLSYNVQGPKLVFVTLSTSQPDVFELPRHLLDFKISKSLGKHFDVELKIRDILNSPSVWAYNIDDYAIEYEGFRFGTTYTISVAYQL